MLPPPAAIAIGVAVVAVVSVAGLRSKDRHARARKHNAETLRTIVQQAVDAADVARSSTSAVVRLRSSERAAALLACGRMLFTDDEIMARCGADPLDLGNSIAAVQQEAMAALAAGSVR